MSKTVDTCSLCGGRVTVPECWSGIYPPVPTCQSCGATKARPYGPVVEMERAGKKQHNEAALAWIASLSGEAFARCWDNPLDAQYDNA